MIEKAELEEARRLIEERGCAPGAEKVALPEAHGRVLAKDITAPVDYPPFNRSPLTAMPCRPGIPPAPLQAHRRQVIDRLCRSIPTKSDRRYPVS